MELHTALTIELNWFLDSLGLPDRNLPLMNVWREPDQCNAGITMHCLEVAHAAEWYSQPCKTLLRGQAIQDVGQHTQRSTAVSVEWLAR